MPLATLALAPLAACSTPGSVASENQAGPRREELLVPMRDGAELAALALLPESGGRNPVILLRTPYGRAAALEAWGAVRLVTRGYAVVAQDVRGKGESDGVFEPWVNEGRDGFDTIEWIAAQPWSNGKVGMLGGDYLGQAQWAAAALRPPALRALFVLPAIQDPFFGGAYDCGVPSLSPAWAYANSGRAPRALPRIDPKRFLELPLGKLDEALLGETVPLWDRALERDTQAAWKGLHWPDDLRQVSVPVMHVMALWDADGIGPVLGWTEMRRRTDQWLLLGPWGHGLERDALRGDVRYGDADWFDLERSIDEWFDAWLKDGEIRRARVSVFVTGANAWREYEDWPPAEARVATYFLHPPAEPGKPGRLESARPAADAVARYAFDPAAPRDMGPRASIFADTTRVPFPLDERDVLFFQTEPLAEARVVGAPLELGLRISTTAEDADFFALLVDVAPSGEARALTYPGKLRARYADGWSQPKALVPGAKVDLVIRLPDVAHEFAAGHRIGLVLRSDWFPRWARNLGKVEPLATATEGVRAEQSVYCGGEGGTELRLTFLGE